MNYEWDPVKAAANVVKHGISFEEAIRVFEDIEAITLEDAAHSDAEDRQITIGRILKEDTFEVILTVVHVDRDGTIRVISARKATNRERGLYSGG